MNEVMSLAELETRFKSEWILLGDPETTDTLEVKKGKVLWHCKDRDELYRMLGELKPRHSAIVFTGTVVPEGTAIIL